MSNSPIQDLPIFEAVHKDVLNYLALKLDVKDISKLCQTSKRFNSLICKNQTFWTNKYIKDFGSDEELREFQKLYYSVKTAYMYTYQIATQNKLICKELINDMDSGKTREIKSYFYILGTIDFLFEITDIEIISVEDLVLRYIFDKLINQEIDMTLQENIDYLQDLKTQYDTDIKNTKYAFMVSNQLKITQKEIVILNQILSDFRDVLRGKRGNMKIVEQTRFAALVLDHMIKGKIPYDLTWEELCNYNIF